MIADLFEIRDTGKYGKGLFATQFIPKGTIVYFDCKKCRIVQSKKELAKLSKAELRFYNNHGRYCDDRLLYNNHSCNSNVMDLGNDVDIVVRDIKKGEEQTEDYRIFREEGLHFDGGCKCGEKNCMKNSTFTRPAPPKLQRFWNKEINAALKAIPCVKQPLKTELLKEHPELGYLFKKQNKIMRKSESAGGVVLNREGKVLVVSQRGTSWSLPKGHIEKRESELDAAIREIKEETGIRKLEYISPLGKYQRYRIGEGGGDDKSKLKTIYMFLFKTKQVKIKPIDPNHPEARWVSKGKVSVLLTHKKDRKFYNSVLDKF